METNILLYQAVIVKTHPGFTVAISPIHWKVPQASEWEAGGFSSTFVPAFPGLEIAVQNKNLSPVSSLALPLYWSFIKTSSTPSLIWGTPTPAPVKYLLVRSLGGQVFSLGLALSQLREEPWVAVPTLKQGRPTSHHWRASLLHTLPQVLRVPASCPSLPVLPMERPES